jgi:hypothetical protein
VLEFPAGTVAQAIEQPHIIPLGSYDVYGAGIEGDDDGRQEYGGYKRKKRTVSCFKMRRLARQLLRGFLSNFVLSGAPKVHRSGR